VNEPAPDRLAEVLRENDELRKSLAKLQAAHDAEVQEFLYAASHDLQEPLRGILSYAQLLERDSAAGQQAHEYSSFIIEGATRMRDRLQHIMIYSRAGTAKRRANLSLNLPLQRALLKLAAEISACSARIVHDRLPETVADESEIAQVFENLISNSLKFRSEETPEIRITAEQGSDECVIAVSDNGVGIEPRFCEHVLLPFKRLHDKRFPGHGLGLAICEKILRANQGRLWVESDGVRGTTVRFTLPA
jgi:two-component system, chemotaxis family, sensor kinase Cph1